MNSGGFCVHRSLPFYHQCDLKNDRDSTRQHFTFVLCDYSCLDPCQKSVSGVFTSSINICLCSPTKFRFHQIWLLRVKLIELSNPCSGYELRSRKYVVGLFISRGSCQISSGSKWILKCCNSGTVRMIPRAIARPLGPEATQYRNWSPHQNSQSLRSYCIHM
jgi:hypothetical protein